MYYLVQELTVEENLPGRYTKPSAIKRVWFSNKSKRKLCFTTDCYVLSPLWDG